MRLEKRIFAYGIQFRFHSWILGKHSADRSSGRCLLTEDLIRGSAKIIGYTRLGSVVSQVFNNAIDCAKSQGRIELAANEKWILTSEGMLREKQAISKRK
jgi:hypothetical protein